MNDKPRLRRDQLKTLLLDAGSALLHEDGLGSKTAPIGYADAFRWLEEHRGVSVSRAQVHRRIWDSLEDYRRDVLIRIVTRNHTDGFHATASALRAQINDLDLEGLSAEERTTMLVELASLLTQTNIDDVRSNRHIAAFDAVFVMMTIGAAKPVDPELASMMRTTNERVVARFIELYRIVVDRFNAAPGARWGVSLSEGMHFFAELMSCLNQGATGRSVFDPTLQAIEIGGRVTTIEQLGSAAIASRIAMIDEPFSVADDSDLPAIDSEPSPTEAVLSDAGRIDRATLRDLMLEAGEQVLLEQGFGHGAEQITYGRVFERIKDQHQVSVARAQVHGRIWDSQNDFQLDLLALAAQNRDSLNTTEAADRALAEINRTGLATPEGRRLAVARAVRVGGDESMSTTSGSAIWRLSRAVMAFHALNSDRSPIVEEAIGAAYEADIAEWTEVFVGVAGVVGYEPRPWTGLGLEDVCRIAARCVDIIAEGAVARTNMTGERAEFRLAVAGDDPADWNLVALGGWCLIDYLMQPSIS